MAPRNVGINSTFDQQRVVINEIAVDVDNLLNAGYATTSYVGTVTSGLSSVSYVDNKVAISTSGLASVSYVDNKVAISTSGLLTPTSSGSSLTGIVTSITAGSGISIDQSTGNVTITSLGGAGGENLDQTLGIGNTSSKGMSVGVVTATSFVKSGGTSSQFLKADGSVDSNSYLTSTSSGSSLTGIVTSITAGSGISIDQSTGNVTVTATGGGGGGESYWVSTAAGIHTLSNVGIGTTNPLTALDIAAGTITFGRITGPYYGDVSIGNTLTSYGYTEGGFGVNNPRYKNNIFIGNEVYSLHSSGGMPVYNVVIGDRAGQTLGEGCTENVIIGRDAGSVNAGNGNNFIGMRAGEYNTSGYINNFIGYDAGNSNTTGGYNNFIGNEAGYTNTTGNNNFYGGQYTGYYNQGGNYNLALGSWAANGFSGSNTTQSYNIHLGAVNGGTIGGSYQVLIGSGNASGSRYFDLPNPNKSYQFAVGIRTDANPSKYWLVGDENFNVGIGTTNPQTKLTVQGNVNVSGAVTAASVTLSGNLIDSSNSNYYFNPGQGGNLAAGFYVTNDPVSYGTYVQINDDQIYAYDGITGGSFDIRSKKNENSYINGGNLGIGTDNPPDKLTVSGKIQIQQDSGSNNRIVFRGQPTSSYRWNIDNYSSSNEFRIYREDDATSANGFIAVSITTNGEVSIASTTNLKQVTETVVNAFNTALAPSSGTLTVDTSLGTVVLGDLNASVTTWAFTNVPTANSKATTVTLIIDGDTAQTYGDACSVNGSAVSGGVKWSGGSAPTATNNFDVITFTIVKDSAGTINVFGSGNTNFS